MSEKVRLWIPVNEDLTPSISWVGMVANPEAWKASPTLSTDFDPPWYHCRRCLDRGESPWRARLSIGTSFCPHCGSALEWPE